MFRYIDIHQLSSITFFFPREYLRKKKDRYYFSIFFEMSATPLLQLTRDMFIDEKDHENQLNMALSKFSSMGSNHLELTKMEQLLVNEELDISKYYPNLKHVISLNPFLNF